jgi:hypothetical protein
VEGQLVDLTRRGRSVCAVAELVALSLLLSSVGLSRTASAEPGTSYAESVDGDLPENPPVALGFAVGANRVQGSVEGGVDNFDSFSFTLAPGEQLDSVILNGFVGDSSNAVRFFTGTDPGADPPAFLGETFMSTARIGSDYLDLVGLGLFGPGVYTISIVGGPGLHDYDFILNVSATYDESVSGDLPSSPEPPLALEFVAGGNRVLGSVEGGVDVFDRFSFTLAPGEQLDSVILNGFVGDSNNTVRFFTGTDTGAPPPAFLGETFMSTARIGSDYLDLLGLGPLGPGVYSISIVGGPGLHSYDFILSVPEPGPAGAALGLVVGLGTLCSLRRARAASARRAPTSAPARRAPAPPGRP